MFLCYCHVKKIIRLSKKRSQSASEIICGGFITYKCVGLIQLRCDITSPINKFCARRSQQSTFTQLAQVFLLPFVVVYLWLVPYDPHHLKKAIYLKFKVFMLFFLKQKKRKIDYKVPTPAYWEIGKNFRKTVIVTTNNLLQKQTELKTIFSKCN